MRKALIRTGLALTLLSAGFASGYVVAQATHLKAALEALDSAEGHLKLYSPDPGGHAAEAIKAIEVAKKHIAAATSAK
jgi:hypothetical protein